MSSDFSQYLQTNGNSSFTGANAQQINSGYEAQQQHPTYPWMSSDQQLAPSQTIISGATVATPPTTLNASNIPTTLSKTLYHTPNSETNSNNFIQAQNTPIVGSNVIRKPNINIKQENANINAPVATNGGITIGSNHNKTPEYVDFTQKCVQLILEINYELIRVCIDYQNNGIVNEQDLTLYKTRLQVNLSYLATVADEYNGNSRNEFKQKTTIPDLSPLPIPRSLYGQKINTLLQRAAQMYAHYKKLNRSSAPAIAANNNNNSTTIASGHMLDPSSTSSHQFKMSQSPNNIISMMNSQLYQKQQQQQQQQQTPTIPPQQPQLPQHIQQLKSQQSSSQPQQKQMLQQQTSQQLHQQNTQQPANRFTNPMISAATMSKNPLMSKMSNATMSKNPMMSNATMSTTYQQQHHPTSQHQNLATTSNISDYSMIPAATNSEQSYQVSLPPSLPPLAGMGNISMGNTGAGNGGAGNVQGSGILPSLVGMGDQYGMASAQQQQQQQLQQLQNVGYTGFIGGGGASAGINGTGFGTAANAFNMMRYPSAGGNGMGNNSITGNSLASTVLGGGGNGLAGSGLANNMGGGIGIMGGNNYGGNTIAGNALGLPSMMNHDNGMG